MKVRILGCGTSTGVPVIGCTCSACTSTHPGNKRTRSSIALELADKTILIDTSTDLRITGSGEQSYKGQRRLIHPLSRGPCSRNRRSPLIQPHTGMKRRSPATAIKIQSTGSIAPLSIYSRRAGAGMRADGNPTLDTYYNRRPLSSIRQRDHPHKIEHGPRTILGFRVDNFAYLTDCSGIPR